MMMMKKYICPRGDVIVLKNPNTMYERGKQYSDV